MTGCTVEAPRPVAAPPPAGAFVPPITSGFGDWHGGDGRPRRWQHAGIDIRVPAGTPVLAAAGGTVLRTGRESRAGKLVVLGHADDFATVYFHLAEIDVATGQSVRRGQVIGRAGITGNATTPHLHFGVCRRRDTLCGERMDTGWKDPAAYWVNGSPCLGGRRAIPPRPIRLTYPVPCAASVG